jgi:hypothetical protein
LDVGVLAESNRLHAPMEPSCTAAESSCGAGPEGSGCIHAKVSFMLRDAVKQFLHDYVN